MKVNILYLYLVSSDRHGHFLLRTRGEKGCVNYAMKCSVYCNPQLWRYVIIFLTVILHRGLRNDFFSIPICFLKFIIRLLFPFYLWTSLSLYFVYIFNRYCNHILDFFQNFFNGENKYYFIGQY